MNRIRERIESNRNTSGLHWKLMIFGKDLLRELLEWSLFCHWEVKNLFGRLSRRSERLCFFSCLTDNYLIGFEVFMKSLLLHNPWFDIDFILIDCGLSKETKRRCLQLYPNIKFRMPNRKPYPDRFFQKVSTRLQAAIFKLDAFNLYEYDRVIVIDCADMLVLGSIQKILYHPCDLGAVTVHRKRKDINSGLMIIGKKFLNLDTYQGLLSEMPKKFNVADQDIINSYFRDKFEYIPEIYNCSKRNVDQKFHPRLRNIKILHFVATKPWQDSYKEKENLDRIKQLENLWFRYKKYFDQQHENIEKIN